MIARLARRMRRGRWLRVACALAAAVAVHPLRVHAQAAAAPDAQVGGWTFGRDAFAELWYHALARVTPATGGPLSLYSGEYVAGVTVERRARGVVSRLDATDAVLREAMRTERRLEVLHFVPLYFVGESPAAVLRALRAALASDRPPGGDAVAQRAALIARTLTTDRARAAALQFVEAAADEWRAMERAGWMPPGPDAVGLRRLREEWLAGLAPALRPHLDHAGIRGGRIVVVPSIGLDGRVLQGTDGSALVVVGLGGPAAGEHAPLLLAVRELAYPLIQRLPPRLLDEESGAPAAAERVRGAAAVRAGALLLEAHLPGMAPAYRALFAGGIAPRDSRAFDALYPASAELEAALRSEVGRPGTPRGRTP